MLRLRYLSDTTISKKKCQHLEWEKVLADHYLISGNYPKYIKDSYDLIITTTNSFQKQAKELNRVFSNEKRINNQQVHEKMPSITNHQEMQIKTAGRYHFTPVRKAIINKTRGKCWSGFGEKTIFVHCCWECIFVQPLRKTVCRFLKILKIELPYDPAIPILSIYQKDTKSLS